MKSIQKCIVIYTYIKYNKYKYKVLVFEINATYKNKHLEFEYGYEFNTFFFVSSNSTI